MAILPGLRDSAEVKTLCRIARIRFNQDPGEAIQLLNDALVKAKAIQYRNGLVQIYNSLGAYHNLYHNDFPTSKLYLDSAASLAVTARQKGNVYATRAMWHSRKGEFEKSQAYLLHALENVEKDGDLNTLRIISNIGFNLTNLGRNRAAIQYYKRGVALAEKIGDTRELASLLANMGGPYLLLNETDSALAVFQRVYQIELKHGNPLDNPGMLTALGKLYLDKGEKDTAYYFLQTGLQAAYRLDLPYAISRSLSGLSKYHLAERPDSALYYSRKLYKQINNTSALALEDATNLLSEAHGKLRRFDSAFFYQRQFLRYHDSVFQEKQTQQIAEMEAAFDLKQKQQAINQLKSERENEVLKRNAFAIAFGLALIIGVLVFFILRAKIRAEKKELASKNWQLENFTRNMIGKSELVEELRAQIDQFKSEIHVPRERIENVSQILNSSILTEDDWEEFKAFFEQVHRNFFVKLKIKHPGLTQAEIRLAALLKLNLTTREMANMLGISPDSANKARYRLRKKLELNPGQDLQEFIGNVSETGV